MPIAAKGRLVRVTAAEIGTHTFLHSIVPPTLLQQGTIATANISRPHMQTTSFIKSSITFSAQPQNRLSARNSADNQGPSDISKHDRNL